MFHGYRLSKHLRFLNPQNKGKFIFGGLGLLLVLAGWIIGPVEQSIEYHNFADRRSWNGIPNVFNVVSNFAFCLSSIAGMFFLSRRRHDFPSTTGIYFTFLLAVFCIGLGSAYYHLSPDNGSLVWDRLPMSVAFMSFFSLVIAERINLNLGRKLLPWLLLAGVFSVVYWHWQDDLRPYIVVQFGTIFGLPYLIWRYSGTGTQWLWLTMVFYLLSKVFELSDTYVYALSDELVSGHTLKHLAASMSVFMLVLKIVFTKTSCIART